MNTDRDNGVCYMLTNVLEKHNASRGNEIWYMINDILEEHTASIFRELLSFNVIRMNLTKFCYTDNVGPTVGTHEILCIIIVTMVKVIKDGNFP
jgi:hypothetical protein